MSFDLLEIAIKNKSVKTDENNTIISPSGQLQSWLLDLRPIFLDASLLEVIADIFWDRFEKRYPFQIAGMETAAIPLLTAIMLCGKKRGIVCNGLVIRKERKTYGLGNTVEGEPNNLSVILIDDIFNSGGSASKSLASLAAIHLNVTQLFVLVDYESPKGQQFLQESGLSVDSVFKGRTFGYRGNSKIDNAPPYRIGYDLLWKYEPNWAFPYYVVPKSGARLHNNALFFGSDDATMRRLNSQNGKVDWIFQTPAVHRKGIWSTPNFDADRLYFGAYNGHVYCLSTEDGSCVWDHPLCEWIGSSPVIIKRHNLLVIGLEYERKRNQGSMVALSLETGEKIWERYLNVYQHGSAAYDVVRDVIVFGTNDHSVECVNPANGELIWRFETGRSIKYAPAIDHETGLVAAASFDGKVYFLDLSTGVLRGSVQTGSICYTTPLIIDDRIFCGSGDRNLYIICSKTLEVIRKIYCAARVYSPPIAGTDTVAFGCNNGMVREIDRQTLNEVGYLQISDSITNSVLFDGSQDIMFVPTYMNEIYCFKRNIVRV